MTDINVGALSESINNKMDRDMGNTTANIDYVVEWKHPSAADPSWYRVYKSGWVEQGGVVANLAQGASTQTVTFLKAFADTNYTLVFGVFGSFYNAAEENYKCTAYTTSSVTFFNNAGTVVTYKWYACGVKA